MLELIYPVERTAPVIGFKPSDTKAAEMLPVIDRNGIVIGQSTRAYCHSGSKPLHPVVHLHIMNRKGELYIQKRSMKKDLLPGYWDTAVGGHIGYGESIVEALFREAGEELGFYDFNPIGLFSYEFESDIECEMINVFSAVGNFNPQPDLDEVEEGRFWTFEEIEANLSKSIFTPNFEKEFLMVRKHLEALL